MSGGTHPSSFGAQLRHHREAAGLSQEDLAERAGLAAKAIGALERGERRRPYPRTVQMLADALRLPEAERRQLIASVPRSQSFAAGGGEVFIGREREIAELTAKLRAAVGGHGGIAMLVGEAGIGKTHLLRSFMSVARAQGARVLFGRALEGESQAPYGPWVEAIERYALESDAAQLRLSLGYDASYIAELAPGMRALLGPSTRPEALGPGDERLRLYAAVTRFCSSIAGDGSLLIVLDDLQWADRDTLGVMRYMAHALSTSRILLVGAYRDPEIGVDAEHPLMTTLASVRHDVACPTIHLGGLAPDEIRAYLNHLAEQSLPTAFVEHVERETRGNPFYAQEVLRHVTETDAGTANAGPRSYAMTGVPDGVRSVVADRVRRLSSATAQMLRAACGFTSGFAFPVLLHLTQLSEGELLDCLDEAVEAGLLRAPTDDTRNYEFAHAIVRHALYQGQGRDRRVRLHRRIAQALEAAYAGREDEHAGDLAAHYYASAELAGASAGLRYALAAAERARSAYAHDRVVTSLRMAWDLAGEAETMTQASILTRLALAEAESVRSPEASESARRALERMDAAGISPRDRAEFLAAVAHVLKTSGATADLWDPLVDRGLRLLGDERDALWARLTLLRDHYVPLQSGAVGSNVWQTQDREAVATARGSGDEIGYARTLEPLEWRTRPQTDDIAERIHGWTTPLALLRGLEVVVRDLAYKHGDFEAARRAAEELLALAQRYGAVSAEAEARTQLVTCAIAVGDLGGARSRTSEALEAVARLGPSHRLHLVPIGIAIGTGYFVDADWPTVARTAEAFARASETHRMPIGAEAAAYACVALVRADRAPDAREWLRDIAVICEGASATTYLQGWTLTAAAAAAWEADDVEAAKRYRRLLLELRAAGSASPSVFGCVDLALARMATLLRDHSAAEEHFGRATQYASRLRHQALEAVVACDHARAMLLKGPDERSARLLARATQTFETLEMRSWLARARTLQRDTRRAASPARS